MDGIVIVGDDKRPLGKLLKMNSKLKVTGLGCMERGCGGESDMWVRGNMVCMTRKVDGKQRVYHTNRGREGREGVIKGFINVERYFPTIPNILQKGW